MSFASARQHCYNFGGDLTIIKSQNKQAFIESRLKIGQLYWTGLNDITKEGTFKWPDQYVPDYSNWHTREQKNSPNKDCVTISKNKLGRWSVTACTDFAYGICQIPCK